MISLDEGVQAGVYGKYSRDAVQGCRNPLCVMKGF